MLKREKQVYFVQQVNLFYKVLPKTSTSINNCLQSTIGIEMFYLSKKILTIKVQEDCIPNTFNCLLYPSQKNCTSINIKPNTIKAANRPVSKKIYTHY